MRWSVGIEAEGDRVFTREEIVELADAVAASSGVAAGIGTNRYGAKLVVTADSRETAVAAATALFTAAARTAGLPAAPIVRSEAVSEAEENAALENTVLENTVLENTVLENTVLENTADPGGPR